MTLKILYAAANNTGSKIQLERFLSVLSGYPYQIKVAAYKKSSPRNVNIDWTLDCLLNMFKPEHISLDNDNFVTYFDQVKQFNPDLVISDLEYFTSYIANSLDITLWQCSSSLINFAMTHEQKYNLGLFKKYYYLFHKVPLNNQRIINMIDNSNHNFVYSHLADTTNPPQLKDGFEWIRPYHSIGKSSELCKHNIVAAMSHNDKQILGLLKQYPDCVVFTEYDSEQYPNILLKDIHNQEEYICNLHNSNLFVCSGATSFLADAFYNNKYSAIVPDINSHECIINSVYAEQLNISKTIYLDNVNLNDLLSTSICNSYNSDIRFLHERILEI